jgi:hypothetical protein
VALSSLQRLGLIRRPLPYGRMRDLMHAPYVESGKPLAQMIKHVTPTGPE